MAQARTGEDQPNPRALRATTRDVIGHCIYGVDKNSMAVELCKVALWLEAHDPGKPLTFLDHRIKCGDSIVGVARAEDLDDGIPNEAFKTLPDDDKAQAKLWRDKNKKDRRAYEKGLLELTDTEDVAEQLHAISLQFKSFEDLPDATLEQRQAKEKAFAGLTGSQWHRMKQVADVRTAQFFIPKTEENHQYICTDAHLLHAVPLAGSPRPRQAPDVPGPPHQVRRLHCGRGAG